MPRIDLDELIPDITIGLIGIPVAISLQDLAPLVLEKILEGDFEPAILFVHILFIYVLASFIAYTDYVHYDRNRHSQQEHQRSNLLWQRHLVSWVAHTLFFSGVILVVTLDLGSCLNANGCPTLLTFTVIPGATERMFLSVLGLIIWLFMAHRLRPWRLFRQYEVVFSYSVLVLCFAFVLSVAQIFSASYGTPCSP